MIYIPNFHTLESMNGIEKENHNPVEELVHRKAKKKDLVLFPSGPSNEPASTMKHEKSCSTVSYTFQILASD